MSNLQEDKFMPIIASAISLFNVHSWCMLSVKGLTLSKDAVKDLLDAFKDNEQLDDIPQSVLINLAEIITTIKECVLKVVSSRFVASRISDMQENMLKAVIVNAFSLFDFCNWYKLSVKGVTFSKDAVCGLLEKYVESLISESHVCSSECPPECPFSHQEDRNITFHSQLLSAPIISSEPEDERHLINVAPLLVSSIATTKPSDNVNIVRSMYNIQNSSSNNHDLSENEESSEDESSETATAVVGSTTTTSRLGKPLSTIVNSSETATRHRQSSNDDELPENEERSEDKSSETETETTVVGSTSATSRLRKRLLTPLNPSETAKRHRQLLNDDELPENEEHSEDKSSETETTVVGSTSTTSGQRKRLLTPLNPSETAKRHRQSSNDDELPENEERSEDETSQSRTTNVGSATSSRVRKRPLASVSSTKTVKRQRQS